MHPRKERIGEVSLLGGRSFTGFVRPVALFAHRITHRLVERLDVFERIGLDAVKDVVDAEDRLVIDSDGVVTDIFVKVSRRASPR